MSVITSTEYLAITGEAAPPDFKVILEMAERLLDAHTLYAYVGRNIDALPDYVKKTYKAALAYQVQYIEQQGGVTGVNDGGGDLGSVTLGKFSYSRGSSGRPSGSSARADTLPLCAAAETNVPFLLAYARGNFI